MSVLNVNCQYFNRDSCQCSQLPKVLGIFKRHCIYWGDVIHYKCHLQKEYPDPITKEILQLNGVIR